MGMVGTSCPRDGVITNEGGKERTVAAASRR